MHPGDHGANTADYMSTSQGGSFSVFGGEWAKNAAWQKSHSADFGSSSAQQYLDTAKAGTWEGGHRTAAIVWAPGLVKPASTIRAVVSSLDIFVTTLALAGLALPRDRDYDGKDLSPLLSGETTKSPYEWFFYYTTCTELNGCPPANLTGTARLDLDCTVCTIHAAQRHHPHLSCTQGPARWELPCPV
eukprot:SAG31_NODE_5581_length_2443_cov_3.470496_2_plen_187_part_01